MISAEVQSLARTGGLGDVVEALSGALAASGVDVVVVTPRYGVTRVPTGARAWDAPVVAPLGSGERRVGVLEARLGPADRAARPRVCLLSDPALFDRAGIYGDRHGAFGDNAQRFATLSSAALAVAERAFGGARPDVVHAHDWHAALALVYAAAARGVAWGRVPRVFTIHNLAFQGVLGEDAVDALGVPRAAWDDGWIRHDGRVNLMKGAVEVADRVTTVSETYAREIQRLSGGHGLDAHLRWHRRKLTGIVNGIDAASFDPRTDRAIARRYGPEDAAEGKRACRRALCAELGLDPGADEARAPLFASVSRLHWLKGIDLLLAALPSLVEQGARVALVGSGDGALEAGLRAAAARWPGRVAARIAFDEQLARRVFAGADAFVVPSRDEPCGLTQMYAMRYGAVPVVTPVGGLLDTVEPVDVAHARGTGVVASAAHEAPLLIACEDAMAIRRDPIAWSSLVARAMARDSAWSTSAVRYARIYEELAGGPRR
jgi:starch synthase